MFEEWIFIIGFLGVSILISYLLRTYAPGELKKIIIGIGMIGVIIHELCHTLMCVITRTPIEHVKLLEVEKKSFNGGKLISYGGHVALSDKKPMKFLQAVITGLAPLYLSFWLFFFLLDQVFNPETPDLLIVIYVFLMLSIIFAAAPSSVDLQNIPSAFSKNVRYSAYQIILVIISIITAVFITVHYSLSFNHEIFFYLLIMILYYGWKYSFRFIKSISLLFQKDSNPSVKKKYTNPAIDKYYSFLKEPNKPNIKSLNEYELLREEFEV